MAAISRSFRVYHKLEPPYSVILENKSLNDTLMFESHAITTLSSSEVDTIKKQYTKIHDAYGCLGVLNLNTGEEQVLYLVLVTGCLSVGKIADSEIFCITGTHFVSLQNRPNDEERIVGVRSLLNSRTFFFAWSPLGTPWDLTLCAQRKFQDHETDNRFFWNRSLHVHFQRFAIDCSCWLFKMICGGVEVRTVYVGHHQAKACLISRLSCERAGTRYNVRGTNDDGHVANFVETEQVIYLDDQISSFIQTRGSVPLFWEQPGLQVGSHKVKMSRGYEASAPAFERHFNMLKQHYGDQVIVDLLGQKEGEHMLSQAFHNHHKASIYAQDMPLVQFDYHSECRGGNLKNLEKLKSKLLKYIESFDFFYSEGGEKKRYQTGTIRTNCLDCLDRTNAAQAMIGLEMLAKQLESLGLSGKPQMVSRFLEIYKQIWTLNGDHVSKIYAGTGALGGGRSKASDAARSASRTIQSNFLDNTKQEAIDILLLGSTLRGELADKARALLTIRKMHASPSILNATVRRYKEYTSTSSLRIFVGTWNVNGGKHFRSIAFKHQSITDWLLDAPKIMANTNPEYLKPDVDYNTPVDIFAIGFEEIVDLNASNIVSASTTNAREWEKYIQKTISRDHKYVLLIKVQLVGVILYIFVRPHLAPHIRDVAIDTVKTGLGGAAGNKGGVGIRFLVYSTSLCFLCAHMAAGQSQVNDRNSDYQEISKKIAFPMGRTMHSHDYVFWCGDFNYRIDLPNEEVKDLIKNENWGALQTFDQLNGQREAKQTFVGFSEGPLNFAPTYKYDQFCDDYDTSDKSRTPAWTDRVLWKRNPFFRHKNEEEEDLSDTCKLLLYTRSELKTSDHRPVMSLFDIEVLQVKEAAREAVFQDVLSTQGPQDGTVVISLAGGREFDDDVVDEIVGTFSDIGDIILVRFIESDMWLIYKSGKLAMKALQYNQSQLSDGTVISVRLKTEEWKDEIEQELKLCSLNTAALFNNVTNSLLGEDFDIPAMEDYDSEDVEDEELIESLPVPLQPAMSGFSTPTSSGRNSPAVSDDGLLESPGPPSRPSPPIRPRPSSPGVPRVNSPVADQLFSLANNIIVPEQVSKLKGAPNFEPAKPEPPRRPSAPPAKPPPPQRPPAGPSRSSPAVGGVAANAPAKTSKPPGPVIKQPLGPQAIGKIKSKQKSKIISIGLPTNVTHHSHAQTAEDAQRLIQELISGGTTPGSSLPPPMQPVSTAGLAPIPVPRSRTSTDLHHMPKESTVMEMPKPVHRFKSMENLRSDMSEAPTRPPRQHDDSVTASSSMSSSKYVQNFDISPIPQPRTRPNTQSCVITSDGGALESKIKPAPSSRPLSTLILSGQGALPPFPATKPGDPRNFSSGDIQQTRGPPPQVPLRSSDSAIAKSIILGQNSNTLLDAPLSPSATKNNYDPFDTSSIRKNFLADNLVNHNISYMTDNQSKFPTKPIQHESPTKMAPVAPRRSVLPVTVASARFTLSDSELDSNNPSTDLDFDSSNFSTTDSPPDFSPPPTPELECPSESPPPPPSEVIESYLPWNNDSPSYDPVPKLVLPNKPKRGPPPPVPSKPAVSSLPDDNSQRGIFSDIPPVPARQTSAPPPIPPRME
ncbi:hypothetical protein CHS0354_040850 [Potamilus streckersoni]|uniref:phosphoinositide 5-phosphatase n=1 Tax=Potamilus streckersoni TaxID=2493646 RepID=A0AAE0SL68_9BIVA|nr:hypothetical protein CHS0354_040850 [Potamilus streckersoni]